MNNKKLSIFGVAGVVALASVAGTIMLQEKEQTVAFESAHVVYPYEIPYWQGVPTLALNPSPSDRTDYHELDPKKFTWSQRLIENSEVIVSDREIKEFFDYSEDNYLFKINDQIYTIHYTDNPSVRLDQNYIKAFQSDEVSINAREASSDEREWLQKVISNPYRWVPISDSELNDYKSFTNSGRDIAIDDTGYNLRFIGADLPELQKQEYREIVNKSIGIFPESNP